MLESFYYAFNNRSLEVFESIWAPDALVSLKNPLGGRLFGLKGIVDLYRRIFEGSARVWVELSDVVEYSTASMVVFSGRETGELRDRDTVIPLSIRTTRVFQYLGPTIGWKQVHHHGSIDNAEALKTYQDAVSGRRPEAVQR